MRIAAWSGPRNLSTALMYAFASRGDCAVWDEPFYAAYLKATGLGHPLREVVIAAHEPDPDQVAAACARDAPDGRPHFYQKHMTLHLLPGFDRSFLRRVTNVFLIRHPARVVASYARKRQRPTFADLGFAQQAALFDAVADHLGRAPPVIDSADVRADPRRALTALCAALGLPFREAMLAWPSGPKPFDGAWAPHWYDAVHASTGFDAPEGPLPILTGEPADLAARGMPYHDHLARHRIGRSDVSPRPGA